MLIDIIFLLMLGLGFLLGYRSGLIGAVFALVSLFLGCAVAVKFTAVTTQYFYQNFDLETHYLPFLVFLGLFLLVVVLVRLIGRLLESALDAIALGFINRFLGGLLWCLILTFMMSLFLWFTDSADMISDELKKESYTYSYVHVAGPIILDFFGNLVPWFKGAFDVISKTLDDIAKK